jgi:hypothetical protein
MKERGAQSFQPFAGRPRLIRRQLHEHFRKTLHVAREKSDDGKTWSEFMVVEVYRSKE